MSLPKPVPALPRESSLNRRLDPTVALQWLSLGWNDMRRVNAAASLQYGFVVFGISIVLIGGLFALHADYVLFPALAAFLVVGPVLAIGLYEKSRRIEQGESVSIYDMVDVRARSSGQVFFVGMALVFLVLLWVRAAVLLYALFFGLHPFPGFGSIVIILLTTPAGWGLLLVGSVFGALFAAFGFAFSALSVPMLLNERTDAFSAMGASMVLVWHNLPVMLAWGALVLAIFAACVLTGLLGLIVAFPVLGHASWHAYVAVRGDPNSPVLTPVMASEGAS